MRRYPTALTESIDPEKQLFLEFVQAFPQDSGIDAALGFDLFINCFEDAFAQGFIVPVEFQIELGADVKHLFENDRVIDVG